VGAGPYARSFAATFKLHPLVEEVALVDHDPEKLRRAADELAIDRTYSSLDAACDSGADAIALCTQNWLHGPQALQALRAGKHVYSAVPPGITVAEVADLVKAVEETGLIYMLGETSYYYPAVVYCRQRYAEGAFGQIVYAEAEYVHDFDDGLYEAFRRRGGERWRETAGSPPMHYPTHSISQIVSVTGAHMTQVSCQGWVDSNHDGLFRADVNRWGNVFSNESALFKMSDGSISRINEFRRIGHLGAVRMSLFGTEGSFEDHDAGKVWLTRDPAQRRPLDILLKTGPVSTSRGTFLDLSAVHPVGRLPKEFAGARNGHLGSHQFLVDDFVCACVEGRQPPNNLWQAARYAVPGIVAHESAVRGGVLLEVPDFGDPPDYLER
jgi:predicted dehydrogenase